MQSAKGERNGDCHWIWTEPKQESSCSAAASHPQIIAGNSTALMRREQRAANLSQRQKDFPAHVTT